MTITDKERTSMTKAVERLSQSRPETQLEASVNEIFKGYLGVKSTPGPNRINQRTEIKNPSSNNPGSIRSIASPGLSQNLNSDGDHNEGSVFSPIDIQSREGSSKVIMGRVSSSSRMNRSGIKFRKAKEVPRSTFQKELEANQSLEN